MNLHQLEARFIEIDKQPEPMRTDNLVHLMNTLEARFLEIDKQPEPMRTDNLVHLMNTLEAHYGTFQSWQRGTQAPDLETAEMRLYRAVGDARVFTD